MDYNTEDISHIFDDVDEQLHNPDGRLNDFDFIMKYKANKDVGYTKGQNGKIEGIKLQISDGCMIRYYDPEIYLDIIETGYYSRIDMTDKIIDKYDIALEYKSIIIHEIAGIKELAAFRNVPSDRYDFSHKISTAENKCDTLKQQVENIKTRREIYYWKDLRWYGGIIAGAVGMFGILCTVYFAWLKCK
jgi:hypothetical protein